MGIPAMVEGIRTRCQRKLCTRKYELPVDLTRRRVQSRAFSCRRAFMSVRHPCCRRPASRLFYRSSAPTPRGFRPGPLGNRMKINPAQKAWPYSQRKLQQQAVVL